mmetsp:Transcript_9891/g.25078  ORF Transcript_9891/g.25078 Transcript_9891/m.25078 type:complete len:252 (-) Transcript_9891:986-1741(-)
MPYSSVSGTTSTPFHCCIHPADVDAFFMSKRPVHNTLDSGTSPRNARITFAPGLRLRTASSTLDATFSSTMSHLLSTMTSANSICCMRSGPTWRMSFASTLPLNCSPAFAAVAMLEWNVTQSTIVTHVSSRATSLSELFPPSALRIGSISHPGGIVADDWLVTFTANVSATSCGKLTPVDSMRIASNFFSAASSASALMRSSRSVQQMHPLCSSTSFSSRWRSLVLRTRSASMFTSAMSLTRTATRTVSCA